MRSGKPLRLFRLFRKCGKFLLKSREISEISPNNGAILDGRDIGTVVFPKADIKFFLTAKPEARARRRFEEDLEKGRAVSFEQTFAEIKQRDERDVSREDSPLSIADDAVVIDTSEMDLTEVFEQMLSVCVKDKMKLFKFTFKNEVYVILLFSLFPLIAGFFVFLFLKLFDNLT